MGPDERLAMVTARLHAAQVSYDELVSGYTLQTDRASRPTRALVLAGVELESARAQMGRLQEDLRHL